MKKINFLFLTHYIPMCGLLIFIICSGLQGCDRKEEKPLLKTSQAKSHTSLNILASKGRGPKPIWDRVRRNYHITTRQKHQIEQTRVQLFVKQYRQSGKQLIKMSAQASPYLYYVVEQVEKRNMPGEIALLPMIESAFEPKATSPKGAAGLWQFIPGTGRHFGLKQDKYYDGRRDITASTQAALDYLEFLHAKFNKNWILALAAYNAGEGTVQQAINRNKRAGKPISFWSLNLPKETKDYVPKLLALAEVVGHPEKHAISLPHIENKPYFMPVDPGKAMDFNKVAKLADIQVKEIQRLNPGYKQSSTHPKGPQQLILPTGNAEKLLDNLDK